MLADPLLERSPAWPGGSTTWPAPRPQDLFVIVSNSGVNNSVVDMALQVKEAGHRLVALTSLTHTRAVPALHPSGKRLADIADAVLDNCAPAGDALLPLPDGGALCGVSTITSALLVQMVVAEAVGLLVAEGTSAPVYVSANLPGRPRAQRRPGGALRRAPAPRRLLIATPASIGRGFLESRISFRRVIN